MALNSLFNCLGKKTPVTTCDDSEDSVITYCYSDIKCQINKLPNKKSSRIDYISEEFAGDTLKMCIWTLQTYTMSSNMFHNMFRSKVYYQNPN